MRSSNKSRSRNKNQNRRPSANVVNRVFDSSGPEGKVRGTPQQIIEKYQALSRDAALSGDRVAAENFLQHCEHYARLLSEAMREQNERREQAEAQAQNNQQQNPRRDDRDDREDSQNSGQNNRHSNGQRDLAGSDQPDIAEVIAAPAEAEADAGLVETPESRARAPRRRAKPRPAATETADEGASAPAENNPVQ